MSEFICKLGHLMKAGEYLCFICSGRIMYEDGMNEREMMEEETEEAFNE